MLSIARISNIFMFIVMCTVEAKNKASLFQIVISRLPVITQFWFNTLHKPFEVLYRIKKGRREPIFSILLTFSEILSA